MTDNESFFTSQTCQALFRLKNISYIFTPVNHSTTNGQVERIHSTILEIANSISRQNATNTVDEIFNAVTQYNNTIYSVTKFRPSEIFFNSKKIDFDIVRKNIEKDQENVLKYHNKKRIHKTFQSGDIVFAKSDRRRKDKRAYIKHTVREDHKDTIITTKNKTIHKDNLRTQRIQK